MAKTVFRYILIASMLATLSFIFINSMLSPEVSSEESGAVAEIIAAVFPPTTSLGAFLAEYTRKIAHFIEYGVLGAELALYVSIYLADSRRWIALSFIGGFFTAFIDETVQIFSGRGPSITDVWIDMAGFVTFSAIVYLVFFVTKKYRSIKEK